MGFRLETAAGRSAAIRAAKKHGAPATVDVEALLREATASRAKWIRDRTDRKLTDRVKQAVRDADTVEALHAALDPVIDRDATPDLVPAGAMVLQPSEERRRSGSHYTPRELTDPIVREALEPILARVRAEEPSARDREGEPLAAKPGRIVSLPDRILDLKVCDPAMGSGAFLVEACRQLADALLEAWRAHDAVPEIPADENEIVYARRLVAQRCLYGVDRNPVAVDLAKLSLWLITLAKDHPLTFLDHALRHGDSLVGLSRRQIEAFHWKGDAPQFQAGFEVMRIREHLATINRRYDGADALRALFAVVVQRISRTPCTAGKPPDGVPYRPPFCVAAGQTGFPAAGSDEHQTTALLRRPEIGAVQHLAVVEIAAGRDAVRELPEQVGARKSGDVLHQHATGPECPDQPQEVKHKVIAVIVDGAPPALGSDRREPLTGRAPGEQIQLAFTQRGGPQQLGRRARFAYVAQDDRDSSEVHAVALHGERQDVNRRNDAIARPAQPEAQPAHTAEHVDCRRPASAHPCRIRQLHSPPRRLPVEMAAL